MTSPHLSSILYPLLLSILISLIAFSSAASNPITVVTIPYTAPTTASTIDPRLISLSIEFFAFPGYMNLSATTTCLGNLAGLRGVGPAVRIGGTTQDRATYDPTLSTAVNYSVSSLFDAPTSLTYGPTFFSLAANSSLSDEVTIGLNRQLNDISNAAKAAKDAAERMEGRLFAFEVGNEPDLYASDSPIVPSSGVWNPTTDGESQKEWETDLAASLGNATSLFQASVYISYPSWSSRGLIPILGPAIEFVKSFSIHSYPQSACGGASTNLELLMNHTEIVSYTDKFADDAVAVHNQNKPFFLGETNSGTCSAGKLGLNVSATCGGGGISSTFGAALWIVDYVLQAALSGVDRLYFHQGTIGNCAYCFWNTTVINAPYYASYFVSQFLGTDGVSRSMPVISSESESESDSSIATYAVYSSSTSTLLRTLIYNSNYYDGTAGTGTPRSNTTVKLSGLPTGIIGSTVTAVRLTAENAAVVIEEGGEVTIGGGMTFGSGCEVVGEQVKERLVAVSDSGGVASVSVSVMESEAVIVDFT